jgi:hypothetical protein
MEKYIFNMLQALTFWVAYKRAVSRINVIEVDVVTEAINILQSNLPKDYKIIREVTRKSLPIVGNKKIDIGIKSITEEKYKCLIEFKLADATNKGYIGDVEKLKAIKNKEPDIKCFVVIVYRNMCEHNKPEYFVDKKGKAVRKNVGVGKKNIKVKVRRVCNSFTSKENNKSRKAICLEVL